ncbi:MAG: hypothetical protein ACT7A5_30325 [Ferrovibrionaceae bacterium]
MRRAIILALFGLLLGAEAASAGGQTVLSERRAGKWLLSAMATDVFSACGLTTPNEEGASLALVLLADGSGEFSVRHPGWELAGSLVALTYGIDDRPGLQEQVAVMASDMAGGALKRDIFWFDQIAAARSLYVKMRGRTHRFDLAGLATFVPALFDCVERHRDVRILPAPVPAASRAPDIGAAQARALRWVERLAADGAMPRAALLTAEGRADPGLQPFVQDAIAGWQNRAIGMVGRLEVFAPNPASVPDLAWEVVERATDACDGDYTATRGGRSDGFIGIYIDCTVDGRRLRRDFVLFKDGNGYLYLATFVGSRPDRAGEVDLVAEDFRRAAAASLARQ